MPERTDPAHTGVVAGRVVGVLTAALVVVTLLRVEESLYQIFTLLLDEFGLGSDLSVTALFWGNVVLSAAGRYGFTYVVGSLLGVVYDWLDDPPIPVLVGMVVVVGVVDGAFGALDARSPLIGAAYVLAWLCYVPVFVRLYDFDAEAQSGPRRLN
jgi:hypothetical protein